MLDMLEMESFNFRLEAIAAVLAVENTWMWPGSAFEVSLPSEEATEQSGAIDEQHT